MAFSNFKGYSVIVNSTKEGRLDSGRKGVKG
jgi:hypothetical protein